MRDHVDVTLCYFAFSSYGLCRDNMEGYISAGFVITPGIGFRVCEVGFSLWFWVSLCNLH